MIILAPISVGELYDKITILKIKSCKISSLEKLANVRRELKYLLALDKRVLEDLKDELNKSTLIIKIADLYEINSFLWDIEERKRQAENQQKFDDYFISLARNVYLQNDRRANVKRDINILTGSEIIEEKAHSSLNL